MNVKDVLDLMAKRGMRFEPDGPRLMIRGRTENMTERLRTAINALKPAIYAHFNKDFDEPNGVCPLCGGRIPE